MYLFAIRYNVGIVSLHHRLIRNTLCGQDPSIPNPADYADMPTRRASAPPTPENDTSVGFDAIININITYNFSDVGPAQIVILSFGGVSYTEAVSGTEGSIIITPNLTSSTRILYFGTVNTTEGASNTTGTRVLIVSSMSQEEIDARFELDDLMILLLFVLVGLLTYALVRM